MPPHAATCFKSQQPPSLLHSGLSFVNRNVLSFLASNLAASKRSPVYSALPMPHAASKQAP